MKIEKILKPIIIILLICLAVGTSSFLYNAYHDYNINNGFKSLSLNYNPDDSTSSYNWNGTQVVVTNGFIKGIQKIKDGEVLVIRALSPLPAVTIKADANISLRLDIENINPEFYAANIDSTLNPARTTVNTLEFELAVTAGETVQIIPTQPDITDDDNYVILGDSRDGYETFAQMITQIDALNPVFVIDNGDLVYSGKPNQYRIFDQMVSQISTTLCTTLGNHDIRGDGRETYTMLYGPAYYSFDYGDNHFIFLDSSRGYAEMQAIPDDQYAWLERDLQKAQGKNIYVISHVPSTDPREGLKPNEIEAYTDQVKQEGDLLNKSLKLTVRIQPSRMVLEIRSRLRNLKP
ncbi:metallophosphoesterase [Eubacteriaceae bacterium ES2]|nr:metallophosphoesterase [Eubacteriaceae bacterium ES2]